MPNVYKVVGSTLFLEDSEDLGDTTAINNSMTSFAHLHCNKHLHSEFGDDHTFTLADNAIQTWSIGNHEYIVNGEITIQNKDGLQSLKKYVCRIQHDDGDPATFDNWSLYGISGLDDL